jgi:uncharacterized protein YbaR (Trm112 family)
MVRIELLKILVCPEDQSPLSLIDADLLARLNRAVAARQLKNRGGQTLEKGLSGGLMREDGTLVYPIVDDIPMMLLDEAIPLEQIGLAR